MKKEFLWLKENKRFLNIKGIADHLNIPVRSLSAFLNDTRPLNDKWHQPVIDWVKKFKK